MQSIPWDSKVEMSFCVVFITTLLEEVFFLILLSWGCTSKFNLTWLFPISQWRNLKKQSLVFNFIEIALRHGYSPVNLLHISRIPFLKNTSGRLRLSFLRYLNFCLEILVKLKNSLTHFSPVSHFYTPWTTKGFLTFSGGYRNVTLD